MNFSETLDYLNSKQESKILLGLERVQTFLAKMGNPQTGLRVIHVAGTNGKGSVCRMLFEVLKAAGYAPGLYTSPHLHQITERIETAQGLISDSDFAMLATKMTSTPGHQKLTYFEFFTVLAFLYFKNKQLDPVILETGLGGRLDATNVISKPLISIITTIGYDHTAWLGTTLAAIAAEKGGIIKKGVPVALGRLEPEARKVILKIAENQSSRFLEPDWKNLKTRKTKITGTQEVDYQGHLYQLNLAGLHQGDNAALAITALEYLEKQGFRFSGQAIKAGLNLCRIPGRWDRRRVQGNHWIFDVAHNPQAVKAFLTTLEMSSFSKLRGKRAIVGFFKDKDYAAMLSLMADHFDEFFVTNLDSLRSLPAAELKKILKRKGVTNIQIFENVESACRQALSAPAALTCALGSFRLVGPVFSAIRN